MEKIFLNKKITKNIDKLTILNQLLLFTLSIVFISFLVKFRDDYVFSKNENNNLLILIIITFYSFCNPYRFTIILIFCCFFFIPTLILYLVFEIILDCCAEKKRFDSTKRAVRKYIWRIIFKFLSGSLDFLHMFFCFQSCTPACLEHLQPTLDVLSMGLDVALFCITLSLVGFIETKRIYGGNITPVVLLFVECILLVVVLFINIIRFKQNMRVSARVRDIFRPEEGIDVKVFYEDTIGVKVCIFGEDCRNTEPEHRVRYHQKSDNFKLRNFDPSGIGNIVVGFHQTSIESARAIIMSTFRPSQEGWIGKGIYFATNINATEFKANHKGALLVAEINMGKVEELYQFPGSRSDIEINSGYETRYLHHGRGPNFDEFIIRDASQIMQYVVVVSKSASKEYRSNN